MGTPNRWLLPTAMSAPHSPGGVTRVRARRSAAAETRAPCSWAAAVSVRKSRSSPSAPGYWTTTPKTSRPPAAARSASTLSTWARSAIATSMPSGGARRAAAHEGHRLGDRGGLVEERRAGDGEAGQVADDGLEVDKCLEPALGDLRLVRRVGGVPGGVLQDVALDHRRGHRAVVAEADHRAHQRVEAGQPAQLADHGALRRCGVEAQGPVRTDGAGYGDVDEGVEGGLADHLEHRRHVVR